MQTEEYKILISNLINYYRDILERKKVLSSEMKDDVKLSLYKLDSKLIKMKEYFGLPVLDSSLFLNDKIDTGFFENKKQTYFRPVDYEYYFLIYSLLNHENIINQDLAKIIQGFFTYSKVNARLKLKDIERTKTGAVRCKTNLRFTLFYLREMGFINSFDNEKRSWSLTLPGFLTAAYICLNNPFENFEPYEYNLVELSSSDEIDFLQNIDRKLYEVIGWLSDKTAIKELFAFIDKPKAENKEELLIVSTESFKPDDKLIDECHLLFNHYKLFLDSLNNGFHRKINKKEFFQHLGNYINKTNNDSNLKLFKTRFSDFINAERLLVKVKEIMNEKKS